MKEEDIPVKNGELKGKYLVTQSNEVIEAMYQLSITAKKFMISIISQIEPMDEDFKYYMIPVADWKKLAGVVSKADYFDILVKAAQELRSKSITIHVNNQVKVNLGLLAAVKEDKKYQMVGARFDSELKPHLLNLRRNFTSYTLDKVMKLRSIYSIRLYEILKCYRDRGATKWTSPLKSLRLKLGAEGMYSKLSGFKSRVLDTAKKELPKKTDIRFEYIMIKDGRKVTDIEFTIYSIPKHIEIKGILSDIMKLVPTRWVKESEGICRKILKERGETCLRWLIEYTNGKKYENYGAYLRFAYENELYDNYIEQKRLEEKILKKEAEALRAVKKELSEKAQADEDAMKRETYLNDLIKNLSPEDEDELNQLALKRLESDAEIKKGSKQTLNRYWKYFNGNKKERALKCLYQYRLKLIEDFKAKKVTV